MRRLMWFTIGFAASVALAVYLLPVKALIFAAALLLPLAIVCFLCKKTGLTVAAVALLGAVVGMLYYTGFEAVMLSELRHYDGITQNVTLEAADYAFQTDYGAAVDGTVKLGDKRCTVRLYYDGELLLKPGDRILGKLEFRYTPAGGLQPSTYHKGDGIFLLAYARDSLVFQQTDKIPAKYFPAVFRKNISQRITDLFPKDTAAFAKALLLGDDTEIDFRQEMAFQKSGIRHVIAVSGLHVSILFSVVYVMSGGKSILTLLIGFPVLFLFCAIAGFTPSVVRACIMQALVILAMTVRKEYDQGTSLAFAVLVILLVNPLAISSVSFQLSVGSMVGIFLFSRRISQYVLSRKALQKVQHLKWSGRFVSVTVNCVSVSIGAMSVTLPLCACYFGMVSVISIFTNLLTLWLISSVFYGIILSCLLSMVWMPAGTLLAYIISWPIRYILLVSRTLSQVPGGVAYTDSPYTILWIASTIGIVCLFFLCKRKSPMLLAAAIVCLYALSLFASWLEPRLDRVHMTVVDVGQGQCILLQSRNYAYMLDCGGEDSISTAEAAIRAMGAQGIHKLDGIILTHYDKDHANGAYYLLQAFPVERLYLPDTEADNFLRKELERQNIPITWVTETQRLSCGGGNLTIYPSKMAEESNESSMCILYQGENCAILVTGDRDFEGEHYLLEQGDIPKLDVLVVGHHGAYTAAGWELLSETKPDVAVISAGEDNLHGHPDSYTLDRLYRYGCIVRRTDLEGTIHIRG